MLLPIRDVRALRLSAPALPSWTSLLPGTVRTEKGQAGGDDWSLTTHGHWTLAKMSLPDAARLNGSQLQHAVAATYLRLLTLLREHGDHQAVRFWNYLPGILDHAGPSCDRYMIFNTGRHEALSSWFGPPRLRQSLVAASAVDHGGDDFEVHVLATDATFRAIENPRQRPAHRYSQRYGPIPPSFARATVVEPLYPSDPLRLITAGTASVFGEDSRHRNDVRLQVEETFINLAVLVAAASPAGTASGERVEQDVNVRRQLLSHCRHVRAYVTDARNEALVDRALRDMFANAQTIELMPAVLCRPDLLVEIEAFAEIETNESATSDAEH